jgi:2-dehydro-3-deoxygluconokinase
VSGGERPDVLTFGETMAVLRSHAPGPLQHNDQLRLSCAGAESTVAIGLARLGHQALWVGRTGDDELGDVVRSALRANGVEYGGIVDPGRQTGLLLRSARTRELTRVYYYRRESAGAALTMDDLKDALARGPRIVHATGITAALSADARTTTIDALAVARDSSAVVSYDVNFRSRLTTVPDAAEVLRTLLPGIDILFCGEDELPVLAAALGRAALTVDDLAADPLPVETVIKRGRHGAIAFVGGRTVSRDAVLVPVVDVVGAGDAFVAGYLSAYLDGLPVEQRLHRAVVTGALSVGSEGDWEGLPTRAELDLLDASPDYTDR